MQYNTNITIVWVKILSNMYVLNFILCEWNKVLCTNETNVSVYQTET
jgi:hypothetical protein